MKFNEVLEILKKCFGKEKDDRYHAIAMLAIYGIIFIILVASIRISGNNVIDYKEENPIKTPESTPIVEDNTNKEEIKEDNKETITNDINYSYSYTVTYNGKSEVYLGKKIDEKEKFTLVKDGITTNYAILNDNYLVQKGDVYTITEKPSVFFKYCDVEKVLLLIKDKEEKNSYNVTNNELKNNYKDNLLSDNLKDNIIKINISNDILKSIDLDFSNYYSAITNQKESLTIHMEFADIGTTEDFEIKVSW